MPTFLLKETMDAAALLPFLTVLINASLHDGLLPASQKHAVITPLSKNTSLDPTCDVYLQSSRTNRRSATGRLSAAERSDATLPICLPSTPFHGDGSPLCVLSDLFSAANDRQVSLLGILDLRATFDRVYHDILLRKVRHSFGTDDDDTALAWTVADPENYKAGPEYGERVKREPIYGGLRTVVRSFIP